MADVTSMDAGLAAKQAKDSELVQLKIQVDRLRGDLTPGPSKDKKLREACTNFEAVFISKLWEQMRATVPKGGYLNSPQEDMYRSMFDRDFSEKLAKDGGIGLGDMLYGQLKNRLKSTTTAVAADGASSVRAGMPARPLAVANEPVKLLEQKQLKPLAQVPQAPAPVRPASVQGDVMPDVEALARRIEEAYDRRVQPTGSAGAATGRRLALIG
jgi:peptidoglycan hydrolase FlgJ